MSPLLLVTGTGTGIGKTVLSRALVTALARRGLSVAGVKPIETGQADPSDAALLEQVSTFHVTRFTPPYLLTDPVSPHLAARREGRRIDLAVIANWTESIRAQADVVVLELAGGLFTPIHDDHTNADLVRVLAPTKTLLLAPDRLGVLHDVIATTRAAQATGIRIDGIVLSAPAEPDDSTGTNADELRNTLRTPPVLDVLPREADDRLARRCEGVLASVGL